MLKTLEEIFLTNTIEENVQGDRIKLHSHTSREQGLFLQHIFDQVKPKKSVEVGFAYGISTLFILEKHREHHSSPNAHLVIEPFPWGDVAMHNIRKEGLDSYVTVKNDLSDRVLPALYLQNEKIQYAYVDTTKVFDIVLQDFYFIDKILEPGGVIIIDDCDTGGINKVVRFIHSLPHYKLFGTYGRSKRSAKYQQAEKLFEGMLSLIPFRKKMMGNFSFKTSRQLGLDYRCMAFQKISNDSRNWDWDAPL